MTRQRSPSEQPAAAHALKARVADFWGQQPCGSRSGAGTAFASAEFFSATEQARHRLEPFVSRFAQFQKWRGRRVLEVGCGIGVDHAQFARHGAVGFGIDLTPIGCRVTSERLAHHGAPARIACADCEHLPFADQSFDFVYSWGVIHHSPDTNTAARELVRVLRPGGKLLAMVYNARSLVVLQAYLVHGLLRGKPFRRPRNLVAEHLESPGTKVYSRRQALALLPGMRSLRASTVVTPYDLRVGRHRFLPPWVQSWVPARWGYFLVIEGEK